MSEKSINPATANVYTGVQSGANGSTLASFRKHSTESAPKLFVYRIYTERRENLSAIVGRFFDSATLIFGSGIWQGTNEESTIIEVVGSDVDKYQVRKLADLIRLVNEQSAVLVTRSVLNNVDMVSAVQF